VRGRWPKCGGDEGSKLDAGERRPSLADDADLLASVTPMDGCTFGGGQPSSIGSALQHSADSDRVPSERFDCETPEVASAGQERRATPWRSTLGEFFRHLAHRITLIVGSWQVFMLAILLILVWAASGPVFNFSDTWQLVINTSTTIVTFLLGILILLEANRSAKESKVVHDELIRAVRGARNRLINIDEMTEAEVDQLEEGLRLRAARESSRPH
jgi:low affinity Fe/Cu permease